VQTFDDSLFEPDSGMPPIGQFALESDASEDCLGRRARRPYQLDPTALSRGARPRHQFGGS
jgi:hypothetical protein